MKSKVTLSLLVISGVFVATALSFSGDAFAEYGYSYQEITDTIIATDSDHVDLTLQEQNLKMKQWNEVKDTFFELGIDERAMMIGHFMSMKGQWDSMSSEERDAKRLAMKQIIEDLLPLSIEKNTEKLHQNLISV